MLLKRDGLTAKQLYRLVAYIDSPSNRINVPDVEKEVLTPADLACGVLRASKVFGSSPDSKQGYGNGRELEIVGLTNVERKNTFYSIGIEIPDRIVWGLGRGSGSMGVPIRILTDIWDIFSDNE